MTVGLSIGSRSAAQPSGQARRLRPFKPCGDHVSWPAGIHTLGMTGSIPVVWTDRPYGAGEGAMRLIAENGSQWAVSPYCGGYVVVSLPRVEHDGETVGDARVWRVEVTPRSWAVLRGEDVVFDDTPRTVAPDATARDCGLPLRWLRKAVAP